MRRLFGCTVSLIYEDARGEATLNAPIARLTEFWWSERQPDARSLWESKIELGEDFFNEIIRCPIPIDLNTLARDEAVAARPRPLPVAHLPAIRVEVPDTAHVKTALPTASTSPGARRGRSRSACVVNGRLGHEGEAATHAPHGHAARVRGSIHGPHPCTTAVPTASNSAAPAITIDVEERTATTPFAPRRSQPRRRPIVWSRSRRRLRRRLAPHRAQDERNAILRQRLSETSLCIISRQA